MLGFGLFFGCKILCEIVGRFWGKVGNGGMCRQVGVEVGSPDDVGLIWMIERFFTLVSLPFSAVAAS